MTPCLKLVALGVVPLNNPKWRCRLYLLILTALEALTRVWVSLSGYVPFLLSLMLCVSKRRMTHCVSDFEGQSWFRSSGFLSVVSPGSNKSGGCIILYRPALSLVKSWSDDDGRLLQCEFVLLGKTFRVVSLYALNRNPARDLFFDEVIPFVDPAIPTVLCGDFNTVFDRSMDRRGSDASDVSRESTAALVHLFWFLLCH